MADHHIDQCTFEISVATPHGDEVVRTLASHQHLIQQIIADAAEQCIPPNVSIPIHRLQLDLGTLPATDFMDVLRQRLALLLTQEFKRLVEDVAGGHHPVKNDFDDIVYQFLVDGLYAPVSGVDTNPWTYLLTLSQDHPDQWRSILQKMWRHQTARHRLQQFVQTTKSPEAHSLVRMIQQLETDNLQAESEDWLERLLSSASSPLSQLSADEFDRWIQAQATLYGTSFLARPWRDEEFVRMATALRRGSLLKLLRQHTIYQRNLWMWSEWERWFEEQGWFTSLDTLAGRMLLIRVARRHEADGYIKLADALQLLISFNTGTSMSMQVQMSLRTYATSEHMRHELREDWRNVVQSLSFGGSGGRYEVTALQYLLNTQGDKEDIRRIWRALYHQRPDELNHYVAELPYPDYVLRLITALDTEAHGQWYQLLSKQGPQGVDDPHDMFVLYDHSYSYSQFLMLLLDGYYRIRPTSRVAWLALSKAITSPVTHIADLPIPTTPLLEVTEASDILRTSFGRYLRQYLLTRQVPEVWQQLDITTWDALLLSWRMTYPQEAASVIASLQHQQESVWIRLANIFSLPALYSWLTDIPELETPLQLWQRWRHWLTVWEWHDLLPSHWGKQAFLNFVFSSSAADRAKVLDVYIQVALAFSGPGNNMATEYAKLNSIDADVSVEDERFTAIWELLRRSVQHRSEQVVTTVENLLMRETRDPAASSVVEAQLRKWWQTDSGFRRQWIRNHWHYGSLRQHIALDIPVLVLPEFTAWLWRDHPSYRVWVSWQTQRQLAAMDAPPSEQALRFDYYRYFEFLSDDHAPAVLRRAPWEDEVWDDGLTGQTDDGNDSMDTTPQSSQWWEQGEATKYRQQIVTWMMAHGIERVWWRLRQPRVALSLFIDVVLSDTETLLFLVGQRMRHTTAWKEWLSMLTIHQYHRLLEVSLPTAFYTLHQIITTSGVDFDVISPARWRHFYESILWVEHLDVNAVQHAIEQSGLLEGVDSGNTYGGLIQQAKDDIQGHHISEPLQNSAAWALAEVKRWIRYWESGVDTVSIVGPAVWRKWVEYVEVRALVLMSFSDLLKRADSRRRIVMSLPVVITEEWLDSIASNHLAVQRGRRWRYVLKSAGIPIRITPQAREAWVQAVVSGEESGVWWLLWIQLQLSLFESLPDRTSLYTKLEQGYRHTMAGREDRLDQEVFLYIQEILMHGGAVSEDTMSSDSGHRLSPLDQFATALQARDYKVLSIMAASIPSHQVSLYIQVWVEQGQPSEVLQQWSVQMPLDTLEAAGVQLAERYGLLQPWLHAVYDMGSAVSGYQREAGLRDLHHVLFMYMERSDQRSSDHFSVWLENVRAVLPKTKHTAPFSGGDNIVGADDDEQAKFKQPLQAVAAAKTIVLDYLTRHALASTSDVEDGFAEAMSSARLLALQAPFLLDDFLFQFSSHSKQGQRLRALLTDDDVHIEQALCEMVRSSFESLNREDTPVHQVQALLHYIRKRTWPWWWTKSEDLTDLLQFVIGHDMNFWMKSVLQAGMEEDVLQEMWKVMTAGDFVKLVHVRYPHHRNTIDGLTEVLSRMTGYPGLDEPTLQSRLYLALRQSSAEVLRRAQQAVLDVWHDHTGEAPETLVNQWERMLYDAVSRGDKRVQSLYASWMSPYSADVSYEAPSAAQAAPAVGQGSVELGHKSPEREQETSAVSKGSSDVSQGLPDVSQGLPDVSQGLPDVSQGLPDVSQGLPDVSQGSPDVSQGLPGVSQGLPDVSQGLPDVSQGSPDVSQDLPGVSRGLLGVSKGLSDVSKSIHEIPQGFPNVSQGDAEAPESSPKVGHGTSEVIPDVPSLNVYGPISLADEFYALAHYAVHETWPTTWYIHSWKWEVEELRNHILANHALAWVQWLQQEGLERLLVSLMVKHLPVSSFLHLVHVRFPRQSKGITQLFQILSISDAIRPDRIYHRIYNTLLDEADDLKIWETCLRDVLQVLHLSEDLNEEKWRAVLLVLTNSEEGPIPKQHLPSGLPGEKLDGSEGQVVRSQVATAPDDKRRMQVSRSAVQRQLLLYYLRHTAWPADVGDPLPTRDEWLRYWHQAHEDDRRWLRIIIREYRQSPERLDTFIRQADAGVLKMMTTVMAESLASTWLPWLLAFYHYVKAIHLTMDDSAASFLVYRAWYRLVVQKPIQMISIFEYTDTLLTDIVLNRKLIPLATWRQQSRQQAENVLPGILAEAVHRWDMQQEAKAKAIIIAKLKEEQRPIRKKLPAGVKVPVQSAGLVLLAPYLYTYLSRLHLTRGSMFVDEVAAWRAVYLLEFLATGRWDTPEHDLVLQKILCGIGPEIVLAPPDGPTPEEVALSESLLQGVLQHWDRLKSTSIDSLREGFLCRSGLLEENDMGWTLTVDRKAQDILVDLIPWSFSTIKLGWMEKTLTTVWQSDENRDLLMRSKKE